MLIWANKSEVNNELENSMRTRYGEIFVREFKSWELSVILRQIQWHFGDRKDISILDFGVGRSPFGAYLNHLGYQFVTCLDKEKGWHQKMNQKIYNKKYNAHVQYFKTDIISNYVGYHDVVFSASVLEHIEEKERIEIMRALSRHIKADGLIIHVVDFDPWINIKKLIDNCGIPISHKLEETSGCREFKNPPAYTWLIYWKKSRWITRVAFFNERQKEA